MENFDPTLPSKGLGDTIAKFTHYTGIAKAVEVVTEALGIEDCGCNRRRETLNSEISYNQPKIIPDPIDLNILPKAETGVYEILQQIHATRGKEIFKYNPGDKILLSENHLLYSNWPHYILIGAVKKRN